MSASPVGILQAADVEMTYVEEATRGTTPTTPSMSVLRTLQRNVNVVKNSFESQEILSHRQISDVRHGMKSMNGPLGFELSSQSHDDWWRAVLGGTWDAVNVAGTPTLGATTTTFTRGSGNFTSDGFRAGDIIVTSGFSNSANNGTFLVTIVASGSLTIDVIDGGLTTEANGAAKTLQLKGKRLSVGSSLNTFSVQRKLAAAVFQVFRGVAVPSAEVRVNAEGIIQGTFNCLGMDGDPISASDLDASPTAAPDTRVMASFEGTLWEAGVRAGVTTEFQMRMDNSHALGGVIGQNTSPDVFKGRFRSTGQMSAYVVNADLMNKFLNETETSFYNRFDDPAGNFLHFVYPKVIYIGATIDPPAEGGLIQQLPFRAKYDATTTTTMSIQRSNT